MNEGKDMKARVGIATGGTREEAVAGALALVREDILEKTAGKVMIKPNFLSSTNPLASTQAGAVRPILELLKDADVDSVVIAEGGSRSTSHALDNFGYRGLAEEFVVEFLDLNHGGFSHSFDIVTSRGEKQTIRYADAAARADTLISVPVAKTHDTAVVTLSLKNMMGCLRRVHRPRMHGIRIGEVQSRAAEWFWNAIEGHPLVIKSFSGVVFTLVNQVRVLDTLRNRGESPGLLGQVRAMSENLVRLGRVLMPDIAVIDAFEAMEGDGPGSGGTPVPMRAAVAGTDPVACDTVMAYMMGFDVSDIGYLCLAGERGLGTTDLERIECVGEKPERLVVKFKPHRNFPVQRRWRERWGEWSGKPGVTEWESRRSPSPAAGSS